MSTQEIRVSVCMVTYNQEQYIAECLDSLVNQQTNFEFEIVVGEDCSTDGTRAIVQKYVEKYPNLIIPLFYEENIGAIENIKKVYKKARGKYIAHLDGDDMALPDKLQKQFDLLEANPDCTICAHDVDLIDAKSKYINTKYKKIEKKLDRLSFIKEGVSFCHSSKMFVNPLSEDFWDKLLTNKDIIDYEIHLESLRYGKFIYLNEVLGQYRVLVGISINGEKVSNILLNAPDRIFKKLLLEYKTDKESNIIKKRYAISLLRLSLQVLMLEKDGYKFKQLVYQSIQIKFLSINQFLFFLGTISPNLILKLFIFRGYFKKLLSERK